MVVQEAWELPLDIGTAPHSAVPDGTLFLRGHAGSTFWHQCATWYLNKVVRWTLRIGVKLFILAQGTDQLR